MQRRALLLPVFFITYALAYVDRANYAFGAAAGMARTLHITEGRTALLGALFFAGYFAFQLPGMLMARRSSATGLVFISLILWGALAALTGVIRSFAWLAADRLLLGVAESIVFPAMLLLLTRWFPPEERSRANTVLILGNPVTVLCMSAVTGFLIEHFGWQQTFVLEGLPAVLWAFLWLAIVRESPVREGLVVPARPQSEGPSLGAERRATLLRPVVWQLSAQYFFWSLGVYGFVLWLPTILRSSGGISMGRTGLLTTLPYLLAVVLMIFAGRDADRTRRHQQLVWPFLLLAGLAMLGSFLLAGHSFVLAFACLVVGGGCMYAPYGPFFAIIPERIPGEHTGEVFALVNSGGALGGFVGSYLVGLLYAITGTQSAGYLLMSLSLIASALLVFRLPRVSTAPPAESQHA